MVFKQQETSLMTIFKKEMKNKIDKISQEYYHFPASPSVRTDIILTVKIVAVVSNSC